MSDNVWYGIHASQEGSNFDDINEICLETEKLGYDTFTVMDHFMNQFPPYEKGAHSIDAWTLLAGLAATSDRIKLGTLVSCYAYRPPTLMGKMATTVDIISKGRLIFGIGAGWHEGEFKGYFGRFPPASERLTGLDETVQICRNMFTNEVSSFNGKLYQVKDVLNSPPPFQEKIPILIAGGGEKRTLKIVAKYADISHIFPRGGPDLVKHKFEVLKKHCDSFGRDYDEIRKGVGFVVTFGDDNDEIMEKIKRMTSITGLSLEETLRIVERRPNVWLKGSVSEVRDELRKYRNLGIGWYTFSIIPSPSKDDLRLLKEEGMCLAVD